MTCPNYAAIELCGMEREELAEEAFILSADVDTNLLAIHIHVPPEIHSLFLGRHQATQLAQELLSLSELI